MQARKRTSKQSYGKGKQNKSSSKSEPSLSSGNLASGLLCSMERSWLWTRLPMDWPALGQPPLPLGGRWLGNRRPMSELGPHPHRCTVPRSSRGGNGGCACCLCLAADLLPARWSHRGLMHWMTWPICLLKTEGAFHSVQKNRGAKGSHKGKHQSWSLRS